MSLDVQLERTFLALQEMHLYFTTRTVSGVPSAEDRSDLVLLQERATEYQRLLKEVEMLWRSAEE